MSLLYKAKWPFIYIIIVSIYTLSCNFSKCPWPEKLIGKNKSLKEITHENQYNPGQMSILICKSKYRLFVKYDGNFIKSYPVVFGSNPKDDKLIQGDGCTPEGIFHIRAKYQHKKWSRFMWIDYPNKSSYEKFNRAIANKTIPKNADIGGQVGIHGTRAGQDLLVSFGINWTKGCISLKRKDIEDLFDVVPNGTEVTIEK